jgi:uncharacterized Zn-finger protein
MSTTSRTTPGRPDEAGGMADHKAADSAVIELDAADLPAFCPNRRMSHWSAHPRVFLDLAHGGQARCPYCSTVYRLKPGVMLKGH